MTTETTRQRAHRLAAELQQSPALEADKVKQMVGLLYEDMKDNLVSSSGEDMLRKQGAAQAYRSLLHLLTRSPLPKGDE